MEDLRKAQKYYDLALEKTLQAIHYSVHGSPWRARMAIRSAAKARAKARKLESKAN
jgi:hypothetical protein